MCRLKGDVNVVISDILNMARDLPFAYCVESQTTLLDYPVIVPQPQWNTGLRDYAESKSRDSINQ